MPEQRILLVEDDEDVAEVLKIALAEERRTGTRWFCRIGASQTATGR